MPGGEESEVAPWRHGWPEIHDGRVRQAFDRVPRAEFVAEEMRAWAEIDAALPIGEGQTISQPFVVALMTQALRLEPGTRVLEIGTGSGYQTAILCELTRRVGEVPGASVWSVERFPSLAQDAVARLNRLGYFPHVQVGDGATGWPEAGPFAAIMVTAAATALPRPLWEQLADGGRMVIPVGRTEQSQMLWLITRHGRRRVLEQLGAVRFVPLVSPILRDPRLVIELA